MAKLVYQDASGVSRTQDLSAEPVVIGRGTDCHIRTDDGQASRRHARVLYDGEYWVEDLASANGVYVGADRVNGRHRLRPGDSFRCGQFYVRLDTTEDRPPVSALPRPSVPPPLPEPVAPPRVAPPRPSVAPPMPLVAGPPAVPVDTRRPADDASAAEQSRLRAELAAEREKRQEADRECEAFKARHVEQQRRAEELQRQLAELSARAAVPSSEGDTDRLKRRIEQLESDLRRRGGAAAPSPAAADALKAAEVERDRLRSRVTELEAQLATAQAAAQVSPDNEAAQARLRQRIEQLEAEQKRLHEASSAVTPVEAPKRSEELERAQRRIEQLESDLRRRSVGAVGDDKRAETQRADLESALRQLRDVERERDSLRGVVARGTGMSMRPSQQALDALGVVRDGLADVRAALRAAGDDLALEQLEQLRTALRAVYTQLGVPP